MTNDNSGDTEDRGESIAKTTRRGALTALGLGGLAALSGGSASAQTIGGGPDSDELSHLVRPAYEGPESELPDPGVEGRRFTVTDTGGAYSQWTELRDNGSSWVPLNQGLGSLNAEKIHSDTSDVTSVVYIDSNGDYVGIDREGEVDRHPTDAGQVVNSLIDAKGNGNTILFTVGEYAVSTGIRVPETTRNITFRGEHVSRNASDGGAAIDGQNVSGEPVIRHEASGGSIAFVGIENLWVSGDGETGSLTLVDFEGTQDSWVKDSFIYGAKVGIKPGDNCWIQDNWIENLTSGVKQTTTRERGYLDRNLFATNVNDVHLQATMRHWEWTGNRTGASDVWCLMEEGAALSQCTITGTNILSSTGKGYVVNDTAGGQGQIDGTGIFNEKCAASTYLDFSGGGISLPGTNVVPGYIEPSSTVVNGSHNHMRWEGVLNGGPVGGTNLSNVPTYALKDGDWIESNGATANSADVDGSHWQYDPNNSQVTRALDSSVATFSV